MKLSQITTGLLLTAATLFIFASCTGDENGEAPGRGNQPIPIVEAIQVETGSLPLVQRLTGEMRARNQIEIYPEITARITEVHASDGDRVEEGEILVRLRGDEIREQLHQSQFDQEIARAQLRQAEASLRRLQAQYERTRQLTEMNLEAQLQLEMIQADIDEAEASVELAEAQLSRAASQVEEQQTRLDNTVIRAPISGVVGNRNAEVGQRTDPSSQLFRLGDIENMRVFVPLTESLSRQIEPGHRAELLNPGGGESIAEATVARISPFLDPITHTTLAELEIESSDENLRPGMFVTLDIFFGQTDISTIIPKTSIYDHPIEGVTGVYIASASAMEMEFGFEEEVPEEIPNRDRASSNPVDVTFVPVEVIAEGRGMAAVSASFDSESWVVTVGQNQLAEWESEQAHIRIVDWDHVMELQNLQSRDMEELIFGNRSQ